MSNSERCEKEALETLRKVAWKRHYEKQNPTEYVKFFQQSKGLWPDPLYYDEDIVAVRNIAKESVTITATYMERPKDTTLTAAYWHRNLAHAVKGGRILQCDKNLGVRFVTTDYYKRLAEKAFEEYEYRFNFSGEEYKDLVKKVIEGNKQQLSILRDRITRLYSEAETRHARHHKIVPKRSIDKMLTSTNAATRQEAIMLNNKQSHITKPLHITFLHQLAEFIDHWCTMENEVYQLPRYQLLLKIHKKPTSDGLLPTRPIIPTWGLPNYKLAKWLGAFLAKMARQIPWALESTDQFTSWLDDPTRTQYVSTYDFTNLYGNEPVIETIKIFEHAIEEMKFVFDDDHDRAIYEGLMTITTVPPGLELEGLSEQLRLVTLMTALCVAETVCEIDVGCEDWRIACTHKYLAMGVAPVAPLSVITLAYLEMTSIGSDKCEKGLRRLIDDIVVDHSVISVEELRKAYPSYLTLNLSDKDHFLDVSFFWSEGRYIRYPYIKEHAIIPLSFFSNHPYHTIIATARNELNRLLKLCNNKAIVATWVEFWYRKYRLAEYPDTVLRKMIRQKAEKIPTTKKEKEKSRGINHIETWEGINTNTAQRLTQHLKMKCDTAWRVNKALIRVALRAHIERNKQ